MSSFIAKMSSDCLIVHAYFQRSKEVLLDIVLAVKMANLPAVIIVLFVSHLSCGWQLTFQLMTTA